MSTNDVPGANPVNNDKLALGCWAEHDDGSLIFVEQVEQGNVVYSIFDVAREPKVEYRDAMPEADFKTRFSWKVGQKKADKWLWHDKTPFDFSRVMGSFPSGVKYPSATDQLTAAQRVAQSLHLRAEAVRDRQSWQPTEQRAAKTIMSRLKQVIDAVTP